MKTARLVIFGVSALAASAAAPFALAQSLKSMRAQEAEEQLLQSEVDYTNSVCSADIAASINWSTASDWPDGVSLAETCGGALSALEAICRSADGQAMAQDIDEFVCEGDGAGPSLSGGVLTYGASPSGGAYSETSDYLSNR